MEEVKWKCDLFKGADPQKVYEELGTTEITPEEIVERAKDENSELHKCFNWNDREAANLYRLQQARTVLHNLVFVPKDKTKAEVRVFSLTTETKTYAPTKLILQKPDEYQALLERAKLELQSFKIKYKTLQELHEIFDLIDEL